MATTQDSFRGAYDKDKAFWVKYIKGRPTPPRALFDRIYRYHESHGGEFGTVHDAGAGVGPYSAILKQKFEHVIVSDIVPGNVEQAKERLGEDGFSYRAAKIEDASDIPAGSVDVVFASQVIHFADLDAAQEAFAHQLKPGGTLVITGFGIARYAHEEVQGIWSRIMQEQARVLVRNSSSPEAAAKRLTSLARVQRGYAAVPMEEKYFMPGAQRISLNTGGQAANMFMNIPDDLKGQLVAEPSRTGHNDAQITEDEEGWSFETDLEGIKQHFSTFSTSGMEPEAYEPMWREMEKVMQGGKVIKGWWPAKILLATRK